MTPDPIPVRVDAFDVQDTAIEGLRILRTKQVHDPRGTVRELFRASAFRDAGVAIGPWAQINVTETTQGAIRGLHGENTTKLVGAAEGEAFGAYLDARPDSTSFGRVVTCRLAKGTQVLVPPGVCNGFQAVSPGVTQYLYCFTTEWTPGMAGVAVHPLDPALGIAWPLPVDPDDHAQLSGKDAGLPMFAELGLR